MSFFFFFNDTATTEIYTLSLHDALPICMPVTCIGSSCFSCLRRQTDGPDRLRARGYGEKAGFSPFVRCPLSRVRRRLDRKSTRLNSSHANISYAVFCLKKKKYTK